MSSRRRRGAVADLADSDLADLVTLRAGLKLAALRFRGGGLPAKEGRELRARLAACETTLGVVGLRRTYREVAEHYRPVE